MKSYNLNKLLSNIFRRKRHSKDHLPFKGDGLYYVLSYRFKDKSLLKQALTHRSFLGHKTNRNASNERMEFLGDAVLGLVVTEALYRFYPLGSEGELTKARACIVSRDSLAQEAKKMGLGRYLFLGKGEERSGGRNRKSILSDVYEAVLGAIFLDGGLDEVKQFLNRNLLKNIDRLINSQSHDNYKSRLLEYVQARGKTSPEYHVLEERGPDHEKEFSVEVRVNGKVLGKGKGRTKRKAEQEAACQAMKTMKENNRA